VGNPPNANVVIQVDGAPAHTIIAFCYILIIIYALTLAPVAWVYAAEVWSLETRATGMSLAAVANWLFNWALGLFVPPAMRNITYKLFIIFGVLCFAAAVQAFFTYPETCGKTLVWPHFLLFPFPSVFYQEVKVSTRLY
jgi:TRAP-type C4-dicarboxylate transport system permease small subunit